MTDDEDSLLDRIYDPASLEDVDVKVSTTSATTEPVMPSREDNASPDITDALDYDEDDVDDDGEVEDSDGEKEEPKEEVEEDGEVKEEKEDGELEDGELEDSDGSDNDDGPPKRAPITAPGGSAARRPIEVGSSLNDNRLSRPLQRGNLPPITRNVPYLPKREEKTGGEAWEQILQEAKKVIHYHENPDAERETPSPEDPRAHIPSLFDIRTHKPPAKDLGPQCIYPSRYQNQQHQHHQNRLKRNSGGPTNYPPNKSGDSPVLQRNRTNSHRTTQAPPPLILKRTASKSPPARGISWSPKRYQAVEISSDSDEEMFKKRPPRVPMRTKKNSRGRSRSNSSVSSNSSRSTIPGVRSISSDSSDSSSRRRRNRRRSYSSSPDRKQRHKRKASRSRSPPPYPPGHKQMFKKKNQVSTGDIHEYRIPKKGSSSGSMFKNKNGKSSSGAQPAFLSQRSTSSLSQKRKRSGTPPSSSSKRRKEEKRDRKRKDARAQTISESDSTTSSMSRDSRRHRKRSRRSRRSPSTGSSSRSVSRSKSRSRSISRTSRSSSSGSDSDSKLPQRYRQKRPMEQEKISSDEEEADKTIRTSSPPLPPPPPAATASASSSTKRSPKDLRSSSSSRSPFTSPDDDLPPPPPPEDEDPDAPPPPPPALSKAETRRQLKMRLKTLNTAINISPESMQEAPTAQS